MTSEIRPLTGIRGIAALWVMVLHFSIFIPTLHIFPGAGKLPAINKGYLAVDLFFVLSGFVLGMTSATRIAADPVRTFGAFLTARVFRLFPLHWFVLILYVAFALFTDQVGTRYYLPINLILTTGLMQIYRPFVENGWNPPTWSIAAELVAYCLFPLIAIAAISIRRPILVGAAMTCALAALVIAILLTGSHTLDHIQRLGVARGLSEFTLGVLLWRFHTLGRTTGRGEDWLLGAGALLLMLVVSMPIIELAAPIAFCCLIFACARPGPVTNALLGNRLVHFLGMISFSIYLDHFLVLVAFDRLAIWLGLAKYPEPVRIGWLALQLVTILIAACVTWRWIEAPGQQLGRRFRARLNRESVTVLAT